MALSRKVSFQELKEVVAFVEDEEILKGVEAAMRVSENGACVLSFKEMLALRMQDLKIKIL